jgi:3-methyl-2-oxobutanoate hydroxymethyltransferase
MPDPRSAPVTVPKVRASKVREGHEPLVMVTAYDAPGARIVDAAGVDMILVGDSVANVVLGYEDTLQVTVADMAHHVAAVSRAEPRALVVGDLPWLSYHVDVADTVRNAATLIRAGARCVKLEGGAIRAPMVRALVDAEIPVMGHIGLTPQSVNSFGGFKVQARDDEAAHRLIEGVEELVAGGRPREGGCRPDGHPRRPDHRHRGRPGLRRPGPRAARPAGGHGPDGQVRAPLRQPGRRGDGGRGGVRRRRPLGVLPVRRGGLPLSVG